MKRVMPTLCILLGVMVVYQLVLALCECRNNLGQCVDCVTPTCPAQYGCTRSSKNPMAGLLLLLPSRRTCQARVLPILLREV